MSMSNGKTKRNKKGSLLSTAAVSPMVQAVPKEVPTVPISPASSASSITRSSNQPPLKYIGGQDVAPTPVPEPSLVSSMADLVHEVIPQGQANVAAQTEPIHFVDVKKCEYMHNGSLKIGYVIVIGLARGYQIWLKADSGNCIEVVSERKMALRVGHLLPFTVEGVEDDYADKRPIFARVDENPDDRKCRFKVFFLSLKTGSNVAEKMFKDPVLDMASSTKAFIVGFADSLTICHPGNFSEVLHIPTQPSYDPTFATHFALSDCFLAFVDKTLNKQVQSVGGVVLGEDASYSGQLMNAAKSITKTVSSIGESLVNSITSGGNKSSPSGSDLGVVTVVDVAAIIAADSKAPYLKYAIAHFVAHEGPIGYLAFGQGGEILLTCTQSATSFHLFGLHPHVGMTALGSVEHLYTLYRGNTAARVINCAFSDDNRWLTISTNHGTTHLFAISSHGGPISLRTHGGRQVNKESRFERTAGLTSTQVTRNINHYAPVKPGQAVFGSSTYYKEHPSIAHTPLFKTTLNPRFNLNNVPVGLYSVAKIRARVFSTEGLTAWASDNNPVSIANSKPSPRGNAHNGAIESNRRISAVFTNILNDYSDHPTLCILNADGVLTAYNIQVRQERTNSTSSTSSLSMGTDLSPSPASANPVSRSNVHEVNIRVKAIAANQWFLHRGRDAANVDPPLAANNLLIGYAQPDAVKEVQTSKVADYCLQHIEVDTYSAPHRRLWMGPQFMFCVYADSEHASAPLFNPNDTHSKPSYATASKRCPVLLEKSTDYPTLGNGFTVDSSSRIVCGSWSSEYDMRASIDPRVKETLEDAMRDLEFDDLNTSSDGLARQRHSSGNVPDLLTLSGIDN
uniref:BCAS3 domain-containing protein n=1 Tax=Panagrellus redivivus TaxID=6233 RepID=A0A7E4W5X0_PANRE